MKINKIYVFVIIFVLLSMKIFAGDGGEITKIRDLGLDDFRIYTSKDKYISLDMSHEEVEKNFGEPVGIIIDKNFSNRRMDEYKYEYKGLHLYFYQEENKVNYISVKSPDYYTTRGIHVGDLIEDVKSKYTIDEKFSDGSLLSEYYTEDGTLRVFYISFQVKGKIISEIILEIPVDS